MQRTLVNSWRWNVATQVAEELKMVIYTVPLPRNGCASSMKRSMQKKEKSAEEEWKPVVLSGAHSSAEGSFLYYTK